MKEITDFVVLINNILLLNNVIAVTQWKLCSGFLQKGVQFCTEGNLQKVMCE